MGAARCHLAWLAKVGSIVPTFRDDNDERALGILRECFPDRPVIGLDSTGLIWCLGSFHCLTQQELLDNDNIRDLFFVHISPFEGGKPEFSSTIINRKIFSRPDTGNTRQTTVKQKADTDTPPVGFNGRPSSKVTPPRGYAVKDICRRVEWLADQTGHRLDEFELEDPENFKGLSENQIGYIGFPLSIAGPLRIDGSYAKGDFHVPLCTLEGTLSLSMTRGFYLTYLAGGITSRHIKQQLARSPVFIFETLDEAYDFLPWVDEHAEEIQAAAESTTRHGKLLRVQKRPIHNRVLMEFNYDTAEAAGQNMVTMATDTACRWIMEHYQSRKPFRYLVESNFCGDKNPAYKTMIDGRGHHVICSFSVPDRLLRKLLRVGVDDIVRCITDKHLGSQMAGVVGLNLHTSNALTALYLALGQDVACVAENCVGITTYEKQGDNLYATLSMPSITVGTVGGATRLNQQRRNLELLECTGDKSSRKLAEIICAAALALEISLAGAIVSNEFARAHAKFGR